MSTTLRPQTFKDKFRNALDRKQVGVTDLTRLMGPEERTREFDSTRRLIHKHLNGEAHPRRQMRRRYETALGLEMGELEPDDEEADPMDLLADVLLQRLQRRGQVIPDRRKVAR